MLVLCPVARVVPCNSCLSFMPSYDGPKCGSSSFCLPFIGHCLGLPGFGLVVFLGLLFSGNVRLLIVQMFIGQNTDQRHILFLL